MISFETINQNIKLSETVERVPSGDRLLMGDPKIKQILVLFLIISSEHFRLRFRKLFAADGFIERSQLDATAFRMRNMNECVK